ncbi:MAG: voltage-gated potassium channel [Planctomycetota bacterium]
MSTRKNKNWRDKLYEVIYEADTSAGKWFDIFLLVLIIASIVLVMLESIEEFSLKYSYYINIAEWVITILFSFEYVSRIITIKKPWNYIFSFYGVIDLLSTIPKYLSLLFGGGNALVVIRALRLLRIFRVLKLARFIGESENLIKAMKASRAKISVFLLFVVSSAVILGSLMYVVEAGQDSGFDNIPRSIYWAIVTLTTVGYGDIAPVTALGQFLASIIMVLGYGVIAVPTGIVSAEIATTKKVHTSTQSCRHCTKENHNDDAEYCYHCGEKLNE